MQVPGHQAHWDHNSECEKYILCEFSVKISQVTLEMRSNKAFLSFLIK